MTVHGGGRPCTLALQQARWRRAVQRAHNPSLTGSSGCARRPVQLGVISGPPGYGLGVKVTERWLALQQRQLVGPPRVAGLIPEPLDLAVLGEDHASNAGNPGKWPIKRPAPIPLQASVRACGLRCSIPADNMVACQHTRKRLFPLTCKTHYDHPIASVPSKITAFRERPTDS